LNFYSDTCEPIGYEPVEKAPQRIHIRSVPASLRQAALALLQLCKFSWWSRFYAGGGAEREREREIREKGVREKKRVKEHVDRERRMIRHERRRRQNDGRWFGGGATGGGAGGGIERKSERELREREARETSVERPL
jgi:hypothetical protein